MSDSERQERNLNFSQRIGIQRIETRIQKSGMDDALRNRLWNLLTHFFFPVHDSETAIPICESLWHNFFKAALDSMPVLWYELRETIRKYFYKASWNRVYDLVDFLLATIENQPSRCELFIRKCNRILEEERSAYRFINRILAEITSEEEIAAIQDAAEASDPVREHISTSLKHLSDRNNPDYRNSIKESISAVESYCQIIAQKNGATLGEALRKIEGKISIHPALRSAFEKLYGYASNADGIRHALMELPDLDYEDAKYMLVSCSAFVNYLQIKNQKASS